MTPNSFSHFGREGRKYWCYFNRQRGYWYAAFNDGVKRQRMALGAATKGEAEIAVRALDVPPPPPQRKVELIVWPEFQRRYLEFKTQKGKAPGSIVTYKGAIDAFGRYLTVKGVADVESVTLDILDGFIPWRMRVEESAAKTAYTNAIIVKNAFKWGLTREIVKHNNTAKWELVAPVTPKRPMYTADDVAKLESGVCAWLRPIVTTLAWSGMRIGELINIRWKDVDFEQRVLRVCVQDAWKPKGKRDRTVPLHPKVEAVLRQQPIGEYVFTGQNGERIARNSAWRCLKSDLNRMGLQGDIHGFRRFFATSMVKAGVDIDTVRQWGGWASLETMQRYLADIDVKSSVSAMATAAKNIAIIA